MSNEDPNPKLFESTIAKISVSQICQSIGFTGSQSSALEAFSNIATLYLQTLAKSAVMAANSSGRTQCNLFDVISGLEDLGFVQGFNGGSNLKKSLLKSGVLREIMKFVGSIDEIPFAKPIPRRCFVKRSEYLVKGESFSTFSHIPNWLPSFPDSSSYMKNAGGRACNGEVKFGLQSDSGEINVLLGNRNAEKIVHVEKPSFLPVKRAKVKFKFIRLKSASVGANVKMGMRDGSCRGESASIGANANVELEMRNGICSGGTTSIGDNVELGMRNVPCSGGIGGTVCIGDNIEMGMRNESCRGETASIVANVGLGMRNGICRGGKRISWHNPTDQKEIKVYKRRKYLQ